MGLTGVSGEPVLGYGKHRPVYESKAIKHLILAAALAGSLRAVAGAATPSQPAESTFVCRLAAAGESANAHGAPASALVCKPISIAMKTSAGSTHVIGYTTSASSPAFGPDITRAVTPSAVSPTAG